ncbi:MAG: ABC-2 transporter permease [Bacilli bacterium]|nr:ABC-2 transporter permease [Bacilli bacterium]
MFSKTLSLLWFYLKKDKFKNICWIIAIVAFLVGIAGMYPSLFKTPEDLMAIGITMQSPSMIAMAGPLYGNSYHVANVMANNLLIFIVLMAVIMSMMLSIKNTREVEEDGLLEMINSYCIGRCANTLAVFLEVLIINIIISILITLGLTTLNIEGIDFIGSLVMGSSIGLSGIIFSCITLVISQLFVSARSVRVVSYSFMAFTYLFRAITDVSNQDLSWLSPMAWAIKTEVFVSNKILPLFLLTIFSIIFLVLSIFLNNKRDMNQGYIKIKEGKKVGKGFLLTKLGFIYKLDRVLIYGWLIGLAILGASYGSVFNQVGSFANNEMYAKLLESVNSNNFALALIPMISLISAILTIIPAVLIINHLLSDEKSERIEQLLALPMSRNKLLTSHLFWSILVGIIGIFLAQYCTYAAALSVMDSPLPLKDFMLSALNALPIILIFIGLAVFFVGWLKKYMSILWLYLIFGFIVVYFGALINIPEWITKLSPFGLINRVPIDNINWLVFIIMIIIAIVLTVLGYIGYNKRDIKK